MSEIESTKLWLQYIVVYCICDIIAILKIMRCNNCSSTLL